MRKEDMNVPALILEAIDIIFGLAYIGLQIFYGLYYSIPAYKFVCNVLAMLLVYIGLSILSNYPERLNRIPAEICVGKVRVYSLRIIRIVKFIFVTGLLIPCIFDAIGHQIKNTYSLIVIGMVLIIAVYYEYRLIKELKNNQR